MIKARQYVKIMTIVSAVVVFGLVGYAYFRIFSLSDDVGRLALEVRQLTSENTTLKSELASTTAVFIKKADKLDETIFALNQKLVSLSENLSEADQNIQNTKKSVEAVQTQVGGVEQTVGNITGAVNVLEKLSKTDPELLQKYSKVFFLNEHYAPERLSEIDNAYLYSERRAETIHALAWPYLKGLLDGGKANGIALYVKSAYRSFDEQKSVKSAFTVVYGQGSANQFSADQGYSEHQLGTTADFITTGLNGDLTGFEKTQAYEWMKNNAYKYGFILSYPENNNFYIFEPWHWRYVGVKLATHLREIGKNFYDMDQREIDKYLPDLFD